MAVALYRRQRWKEDPIRKSLITLKQRQVCDQCYKIKEFKKKEANNNLPKFMILRALNSKSLTSLKQKYLGITAALSSVDLPSCRRLDLLLKIVQISQLLFVLAVKLLWSIKLVLMRSRFTPGILPWLCKMDNPLTIHLHFPNIL